MVLHRVESTVPVGASKDAPIRDKRVGLKQSPGAYVRVKTLREQQSIIKLTNNKAFQRLCLCAEGAVIMTALGVTQNP